MDVGVIAREGYGLSIVHQLDISVAAGSSNPHLVRPGQLHLPGTRKLNLLQVRREDLDVAIERRRDGLLTAHIIGHCLEDLGGIVRSTRGRTNRKGDASDHRNLSGPIRRHYFVMTRPLFDASSYPSFVTHILVFEFLTCRLPWS
jgi:hypothetical protein